MATKKFPNAPQHPERICWGCDLYCAANDLRCGNGSDRTPHPAELFGDDWAEWGISENTGAATAPAVGTEAGAQGAADFAPPLRKPE
ncbi:DUF3079 domain-containing protein [Acidovorax radicis]|uniref:DUF3079 domain-containing protein n=1 Tax=Acidovorax radicis TaxID=758826 RepID=UPI001CF8D975|nr:DUF3079 domain-containing protein [Acidovorax radicis]UCU97430.1 DUF3079 domain-containing protein [Acidovorax radicis]